MGDGSAVPDTSGGNVYATWMLLWAVVTAHTWWEHWQPPALQCHVCWSHTMVQQHPDDGWCCHCTLHWHHASLAPMPLHWAGWFVFLQTQWCLLYTPQCCHSTTTSTTSKCWNFPRSQITQTDFFFLSTTATKQTTLPLLLLFYYVAVTTTAMLLHTVCFHALPSNTVLSLCHSHEQPHCHKQSWQSYGSLLAAYKFQQGP